MEHTANLEGNRPITELIDKFDKSGAVRLRRHSNENIHWKDEEETVDLPWNAEKAPPPKRQTNDNWLAILSYFALPGISMATVGLCALLLTLVFPRFVSERFLFPVFRYFFGLVWPAYWSFRSEVDNNQRACRKWIAYWISYVFISSMEAIIDQVFFFLPFFYEIKIVLWMWILSPYTTGFYLLYTRLLYPFFIQKEEEISQFITKRQEKFKPTNGFCQKTFGYISYVAKSFSQQISPILCDVSGSELGFSTSRAPSAESTPLAGKVDRRSCCKKCCSEETFLMDGPDDIPVDAGKDSNDDQ